MSRIKIIILIAIIVVLSIIFIDNRDPITLKFLCGDDRSAFCPQSIPLPLAVWIALFTFTGAIVGSLIPILNRYGYQRPHRKSVPFDQELYSRQNKGQSSSTRAVNPVANSDSFKTTSNYEAEQEPQSVERSGSTYSYKYREASERQHKHNNNDNNDFSPKTSDNFDIEPNQAQGDEEDWI